MYIVFLYIQPPQKNVHGSSTEMTTANERKTVVLYFDSSQVGNGFILLLLHII